MTECQHCGTAAPEGRTMCPNCRRRMAPAAGTAPASPPPPVTTAAPPPPPPPPATAPPVVTGATATPLAPTPQPAGSASQRGALAGWVVALLAVVGLVALWAAVVQFQRASLVSDLNNLTLQKASDADDRVAAAVGVEIVALLIAGILFITWFYRLCKRIRASRPDAFRHGVGWAIGGWFVPIWSLFRPKQMVDDAWRAADKAKGELPTVPVWVHLWWASFLLSSLIAGFGGRQYGDDSLDALATSDRISAVGDLITVIGAPLAIALVWTLSRRGAEVAALAPAPAPVSASAPVPDTTAYRFNPPPGWPAPPAGWVPPPNWRPDPSWPPPPPGWQLWVPRQD